jgi:monoterpene epsilon-lactone hydrolase
VSSAGSGRDLLRGGHSGIGRTTNAVVRKILQSADGERDAGGENGLMPSQEMQEVIDYFRRRRAARANQPPATLEATRAAFAPAGRLHPLPEDVTVTDVDAGGVPAHWLVPPGANRDRVLLYVHGGGYTLGSLRSHGELAARIGRAAGTRVLFPEYRLAPEHPFPAAVDDVLAAWRWLRAVHGADPASIVVAGDSSGGGLTLALLQALRDAHETLPAGAVLLSPLLDLTASGASIVQRADEDPIFTPDAIRGLGPVYLGDADPRTPAASPLFGSMNGLPPLLVQVGSAELLLSDSERAAGAAGAAGVDATLEIGDGLPHVYQSALGTPEAASATRRITDFIRQLLDSGGRHIGRPERQRA